MKAEVRSVRGFRRRRKQGKHYIPHIPKRVKETKQ
jgi:hypothetical protein